MFWSFCIGFDEAISSSQVMPRADSFYKGDLLSYEVLMANTVQARLSLLFLGTHTYLI